MVTRVFCFVLAIYWLYVLGFSHIGGFVFTHTNLTDLTKYSFIAGFFFHAKRSSPPEGAKGNLAKNAKISFIAGFLVSHRSHESHRWRVASPALVGFAECSQPDGTYERKRCMLS